MERIKNLPIPICGLILAILSFGNLALNLHDICGIIGGLLLVLVIAKILLYPKKLVKELNNPIIATTSALFPMALMQASIYINSKIFWLVAIMIHILLIIYVTFKFKIKIKNFYATYFIPYIGFGMVAINAPTFNEIFIGQISFYFSLISLIILICIVTYRYLNFDVSNSFKPLICIYAAPFSLVLVGYCNSFSSYNETVIWLFFSLAIVFYVFAVLKLIEYRHLDFYPSFSAYTFPFVISCFSTQCIYHLFNIDLSFFIAIQSILALILIIYVLARYLEHLFLNKFHIMNY